MKWTRQRCQDALSTLATAGFEADVGIRDHELDAAQAAACERTQELGPEGLGLRGADRHAKHLAPAVAVDPDGDDHRHRDDAPLLAHLHVGGIEPHVRPIAFERAIEEGGDLVVDLAAEPRHLALRHAGHAQRLDQVVDRAGRDALHVGFLDHRGERLLAQAPRLQEGREVAALAQLWDAQLDRAGARLPYPIAVAVALIKAIGAALAVRRTGLAFDLELHQALRREANHLAQQIAVGALLQQRAQVHHVLGHRGSSHVVQSSLTKPYEDSR